MLATVGVAFALLITAVELSKEDDNPVYDLGLDRSSPQYLLFLAVCHLLSNSPAVPRAMHGLGSH